jgi:predicted secreted protein
MKRPFLRWFFLMLVLHWLLLFALLAACVFSQAHIKKVAVVTLICLRDLPLET